MRGEKTRHPSHRFGPGASGREDYRVGGGVRSTVVRAERAGGRASSAARGVEIPPELFQLVAQVFAFVLRLGRRERQR